MNFDCAQLLPQAAALLLQNRRVIIAQDKISAIEPCSGGRFFVMPPLSNAHDHARTVRMSSLGARGRPLESWLHYRTLLPAVSPYLATSVALARAAMGGAGNVMVHYTRTQGLTGLVDEAAEVARAADDVGVRVGFAVGMADCNPLVYGPSDPALQPLSPNLRAVIEDRFLRPPLPVNEQIALVDAIADAAGSSTFDVQYGPGGPHWASAGLLERIADASKRTARRVHMHLLETRYQRAWADRTFPEGILKFLDRIGILNDRLTLAHCTWATDEELDLIAERGVTIALNSSSNLHLRSGIAPLFNMVKRKCKVAMGIDGQAFDDDDDGIRELRVIDLLHGAEGFITKVSRREILAMACQNGVASVRNKEFEPIGVSASADLLLLDWNALNDDRLRDDLDAIDLLFSRGAARHIAYLVVGGRVVVRDGRAVGIDYDGMRQELLARLQKNSYADDLGRAAVASLQQAVGAHFEPACIQC